MSDIFRGEIWLVNLDPTLGREQAGTRPALVISENLFNQSYAELVIVIPITSQNKNIRSHVPIAKGEGGLEMESYAKCEDVRSISKQRLKKKLGKVSPSTIEYVEEKLRFLMAL
ncbi:MAG: type II toxin-antitoxin system PemK/MazF family toxin [Actinomycetota bacterium]